MSEFLAGVTLTASVAVAVVFMTYYRDLGDRLFAFFAASFGAIALSRLLFMVIGEEDDARPIVYLVRLVGYVLLLVGVLDKNRRPRNSARRRRAEMSVQAGGGEHPGDRE